MNKNQKTAGVILLVVAAMIGLSFAAVPMYRLFCAKTGFAGTPLLSQDLPKNISDRVVTVSFDARVDSSLPWEFKPEQRKMVVHVGQKNLASFTATNLSAQNTTGSALYNVTPDQIGQYFHKVQCFCFNEQMIPPGKTVHFPVVFFIDPSLLEDAEMDDLTDVTLSYTFYATNSKALDKAIESYGDKKRE